LNGVGQIKAIKFKDGNLMDPLERKADRTIWSLTVCITSERRGDNIQSRLIKVNQG
jgi:hypothetical protein